MKYIFLTLLLFVSSCAAPGVKLVPVSTKPVAVSVPDVQPLSLNSIQWKVYNVDDLKSLIDQLQKQNNKNYIIFGLDATNYQNFNLNLAEITRYLSEQKAIIVLMKNVLEEQQKNIPTSPSIPSSPSSSSSSP